MRIKNGMRRVTLFQLESYGQVATGSALLGGRVIEHQLPDMPVSKMDFASALRGGMTNGKERA